MIFDMAKVGVPGPVEVVKTMIAVAKTIISVAMGENGSIV